MRGYRIGGSVSASAMRRWGPAVGAMALMLGWASPGMAQTAAASGGQTQQGLAFNIPAQDLNGALLAFARSAGVQIFYDVAWVQGRQSAALSGTFTTPQALSQLLQGSGLTYRFSAPGTVTLEQAAAQTGSSDAVTLGPVTVEGQQQQAQPLGEIGALPPVYAGGQVARGARLGMLGNTDMMDTPYAVTSYTSELIENQQARTLAGVLENDPSVRYTTPAGHTVENFKIRGFSVLNNDVALNGLFGLAPYGHVPTEFLERVEVLKGPSSMLNGMSPNGAVGGTVNLVTKHAGDQPLLTVTEDFTSDSQFGTHVDIGHRFGPENEFGVRVNGVFRDGQTGVEDQSKERGLGAVGLDWHGSRLRLSLDAYDSHERNDNGSPMNVQLTGTSVPSAPDSDANAFRGIFTEQENQAVMGRAELDLAHDVTAYAAAGTMSNSYSGTVNSTHLLGVNASGVSTTSSTVYQRGFNDQSSGEAGLRGRFRTGNIGHQAVLAVTGLDMASGMAYNRSSTYTTNLYNPSTPLLAKAPGEAPTTAKTQLTSLAVADTLSFYGDTLAVTVGGRQQRVHDKAFDNGGTETTNYDDSDFSPNGGVVLKPWADRQVSFYGNYSEALTKGDRVTVTTASNYGYVFAPYKTKQWEAGVKWDAGNFTNTLAVFDITKPGMVLQGNTYVLGEQRNQGTEWTIFGALTPQVRVLGGASYTSAKLTRSANGLYDGNTAYGTPKWQGNAGLEWDPPVVQGLTLEGRAVYTGEQYVNSANTLKIPSWWRFDIGARYSTEMWDRDLTLRAYVYNLADSNYWVGGFSDGYVTQSSPRTFMLSATASF